MRHLYYLGLIGVGIVGYVIILAAVPISLISSKFNNVQMAKLSMRMYLVGAKLIMNYVDKYDIKCGWWNRIQAWATINAVEDELKEIF